MPDLIFVDAFNVPYPNPGNTWTNATGSTFVSSGGILQNTSAAAYGIYSGSAPPHANYMVEALIKRTTSTNAIGVVCRATLAGGSMDNYYMAAVDASSNLAITKKVGTVYTALGSVPITMNINTFYKIRMEIVNSTINVWWENIPTPVLSIEDSEVTATGNGGIYSYNINEGFFDNFLIKESTGSTVQGTSVTYRSDMSWTAEGATITSTTNPHLIAEYPVRLTAPEDITFYIQPIQGWAALPTTYIDGTSVSTLWTEIEYRNNPLTTETVKRYSYQETQQSLIANTWTPIKISSGNYALEVPEHMAIIRVYLGKGEAGKYICVDSVPDITNFHFEPDLIGQ